MWAMARASVSDPTQSSFASTWWSNPASTSRPPLVARARARLARPPPLSSRHHVPPTKRRRVRSARHIHAHHATHGDAPSSLDAAHAHHDARKSPQVSTSPTRSNAQSIAMRVRTLKSQIDRDDARRKHRRLVEHPLTTSTRMSPCAHPIGVALSRHHHHHHHQSSSIIIRTWNANGRDLVCVPLGDPSHHHHHHHHSTTTTTPIDDA